MKIKFKLSLIVIAIVAAVAGSIAVIQLRQATSIRQTLSMRSLEGSREVINEGLNLEKATLEITNGMNEMASGAEQVNMAVHRVNEISAKNREDINTLIREVSRFKV